MVKQPARAAGSTEKEVILKNNGHCPVCLNKILFNEGDKQLLKGRISIVENGKLKTKCKACSTIVIVPLEMLKALQVPVKIGDKTYKMSLIKN